MGSDSRHRRFFLDAAQSAGIDTFCRFHDRRRITAPSLEEFASVLGRSKLSFNNGWMDTGPAIITGRVAEVILAGAVLLQEVGTAIDDYLVPFVHYVPVANIHQFVAFSQFLLEENELRAQIAQDARRYWIEHYSSARFWRHVHRALFPEAAVAR